MVSATPGYFFQPGKNSLWLKQLAGLPKTPWRGLLVTGYFFQPGKNSLWLKQLAGLPKTPWRDLPVTPGVAEQMIKADFFIAINFMEDNDDGC